MQIGMLGLGRMGPNMVRRLRKHGQECVVYDRSPAGVMADSGEARWAIQAALEKTVPVEVLSAALCTRFGSRQPQPFVEKVLSAMRHKFGGHLEQVQGFRQAFHGRRSLGINLKI